MNKEQNTAAIRRARWIAVFFIDRAHAVATGSAIYRVSMYEI